MAHEAGALVVVDAAQSAAHVPLAIEGAAPEERLDVVCLSGHKIYAPGSPGVIVARKALFDGVEPADVGGGIVDFVDTARYHVTDHLPEREETGTPNLPGSLTLAAALLTLMRVGMDAVEADERALTAYALERFTALDGLRLYGPRALDEADRIGVLTFNLDGLPHGLVTAALNDYFGIAVRNECFCAQPFVRQLLGIADAQGVAPDECLDRCAPREQPGMVRVSLGLYNTRADIDACADALADLAARPAFYRAQYAPVPGSRGDWRHRTFRFAPAEAFRLDDAVDAALAEAMG
jgi:selenocysteine lyase/cysteine desulfurase